MSIPPRLPQDDPGSNQPESRVPPTIAPPSEAAHQPSTLRQIILVLLNLYLWVFLVDAVVSLVDDSAIVFGDVHALTVIRLLVAFLGSLMALLIYSLMGLTPLIPKRLFLPITLFAPVMQLVGLPCLIYSFHRIQQFTWVCSLFQVILGLVVLYYAQGRFQLGWSLVKESSLGTRRFTWLNLSGFLCVNVFVLLPAVVVYLFVCAVLAVGHFSDGFLALRPAGLSVQARKYVRPDGKTIQLIPMAHIGDAEFYQKLNETIPTNSIILLEGVTDNQNLLTNRLSYKRMAQTLGLTEQKLEFKPGKFRAVRADVDVEQFTKNTLEFLNLVALIHSKGVNAQTLPMLLQYKPPPNIEEQVMTDILQKRNQHLLEEIQTRLAQSENLVVPWGAAHMPGIAEGIQKAGFHLDETREYLIIRFGSHDHQRPDAKGKPEING